MVKIANSISKGPIYISGLRISTISCRQPAIFWYIFSCDMAQKWTTNKLRLGFFLVEKKKFQLNYQKSRRRKQRKMDIQMHRNCFAILLLDYRK